MRHRAVLLVATLACFLVVGCGGGGDSSSDSATTASMIETAASSSAPPELTEQEEIAAQGQECVDARFDRECYEAVAAEWLIATDDSGEDLPTVRCYAHGAAARLTDADLQTYVEDEIVADGAMELELITAIARAEMQTYWDERCGD